MKKLNGFEQYLIITWLEMVKEKMKSDIDKVESAGKMPMMTKGYVDMIIEETLDKVAGFTKKEKQTHKGKI